MAMEHRMSILRIVRKAKKLYIGVVKTYKEV